MILHQMRMLNGKVLWDYPLQEWQMVKSLSGKIVETGKR